MQRNGHLVKAKPREESNLTSNNLSGGVLSRGCSADVRRCDEELAKTGIAKKLKQPAWFTQEGSIVQLEEEAFGLKSQ